MMRCLKQFLLIISVAIIKTISASNSSNTLEDRESLDYAVHEEYDDNFSSVKNIKWSVNDYNRPKGSCLLDITKDFGNPSPICVYNGSLLEVDWRGLIRIGRNENITVSCPGRGRLLVINGDVYTSRNEMKATCVIGSKFNVDGLWTGKFKMIECNGGPHLTIRNTYRKCAIIERRSEIYEIGFTVDGVMYPLYEACFNKEKLFTTYVHHTIVPQVHLRQPGGKRPYFHTEKQVFGEMKISEVYNIHSQQRMVNSLMDVSSEDDRYISEINFLTRLQLAPRLDFMMRTDQRGSYTYINTIPQWKHIKFGDWKRLEHGIRVLAYQRNKTLEVWTGQFRIWKPWKNPREEQEIYLAKHPHGKFQKIVPVPLYVYKLIYMKKHKKAVAFVSVNLPFTTKPDILESKVFCMNICKSGTAHEFNWIDFQHNMSLIFCCRYAEFARRVKDLPKLDVREEFF